MDVPLHAGGSRFVHAQGSRLCAGSDDSISLALKRPPALLPRALQAFPLLSHADLGVQSTNLPLLGPLEMGCLRAVSAPAASLCCVLARLRSVAVA